MHDDRSKQCVEEELKARINAALATPHTDDQEHRNEARLEEDIEKNEIKCCEHADHQRFKHKKRDHIFSDALLN